MKKNEQDLSLVKKQLKEISTIWNKLQIEQKTALFEIQDENVDWNREIKLDDINNIDDKLSHSFNETPVKPEKKELKMPKIPKSSLISNFSFLYANLLLLSFGISILFFFSPFKSILPIFIVSLLCFIFSIIKLIKNGLFSDISGKKAQKKYESDMKVFENSYNYNINQYPSLLEEYNLKMVELRKKYLKIINETHQKINKLKKKLYSYDLIPPTLYSKADYLLELLNFRANNLKEAINVCIAEQKEEEYRNSMLKLEEEKNNIIQQGIEAQQAELIRHNQTIERQNMQILKESEKQTNELKKQTKIKQQSNNNVFNSSKCFACQKSFYCQRDSKHCTGFMPKSK